MHTDEKWKQIYLDTPEGACLRVLNLEQVIDSLNVAVGTSGQLRQAKSGVYVHAEQEKRTMGDMKPVP